MPGMVENARNTRKFIVDLSKNGRSLDYPDPVVPPEYHDPIWDVFLADDSCSEPEPEYGDFWLDGHDVLGR